MSAQSGGARAPWRTLRMHLAQWLPARDGARVALLLGVFAAVWLTALARTHISAPVDNMEQLTWVRSLQWGYYKHPPLPTWLLWPWVQLLGLRPVTTYMAGAATVLPAIGLLWWLLAVQRGRAHATVALLATLCVSYYNLRLHYYNHNVVLLLFVAAAAALCWRAMERRRLGAWLALGVVLGLGALAKYQMAVAVVCLLAYWLQQRGWRDPRQRQGLLLAALVALVIVTPHLAWLVGHQFGPFGYAMKSSLAAALPAGERQLNILKWLVYQLLSRAMPAWLLLAWYAWSLRSDAAAQEVAPSPPVRADRVTAFWLCWGVMPIAFMTTMGLITGAELQMHWGTPFLPMAVPAVMELWGRGRWWAVRPAALVGGFLAMQLLLLAFGPVSSHGPRTSGVARGRDFNGMGLAATVGPLARRELGGPVRIVSGSQLVAGAVALALEEKPLVLLDGRPEISPWIAPGMPAHCGVLEVGWGEAPADGHAAGARFPSIWWRASPGEDPEKCVAAFGPSSEPDAYPPQNR